MALVCSHVDFLHTHLIKLIIIICSQDGRTRRERGAHNYRQSNQAIPSECNSWVVLLLRMVPTLQYTRDHNNTQHALEVYNELHIIE
jgi:hypothetical protein